MITEYRFKGKIIEKGYISIPIEILKDLTNEHIDSVDITLRLKKKDSKSTEASEAFWSSFGSWEDEKSADEIIEEIHRYRKSSKDIVL